jgi:hypothetical protein
LCTIDGSNLLGDEVVAKDNIYDFSVVADCEKVKFYTIKKNILKKFLPPSTY